MSDFESITKTNQTADAMADDKFTKISTFELPQNYSILINKLEQLALGLDSALGNISLGHKQLEIAVSGSSNNVGGTEILTTNILDTTNGSNNYTTHTHSTKLLHSDDGDLVDHDGLTEMEYSRVVSDIWIGVILTLLIVSVIFFICSCFLYHKFQQWKNSYRTNHNDTPEICRHYSPDFEVESLPSYTIVSGLPTYDDAIEEFRKAGIILTSPIPIIKIFDKDGRENNSAIVNMEPNGQTDLNTNPDNISINSTNMCSCGAGLSPTTHNFVVSNTLPTQVIELSPDHLAQLSNKRLSLQIAFNQQRSGRRSSRPRIDLLREVNRNNLIRSVANNNVLHLQRSSSTNTLTNPTDISPYLNHHRGSLC